MPAADPLTLYCDSGEVADLLSDEGVKLRLDDDADGNLTGTEAGRLARCVVWATNRLNVTLLKRFDLVNLAVSPAVREWCMVIAAFKLCGRRGNKPPAGVAQAYKEICGPNGDCTSGLLYEVGNGTLALDVPEREFDGPALDNVRVDFLYPLRKVRVERPISERTPAGHAQQVDRVADVTQDTW